MFDDGLKLADMDASIADGAETGDGRWSPTYAAPELARHKVRKVPYYICSPIQLSIQNLHIIREH